MDTLDQFKQMAKVGFNGQLQAHKQAGGKVMGIFCSYLPEELVAAAGFAPFRMRAVGSTKTSLGDTWFSAINCSYVRHVMDLAMEGGYSFLDGVIFMNSCDHVRRLFDNWKRGAEGPDFIEMFAVPHKRGDEAAEWYRQELELLKGKIESHFGIEITGQALRDAISVSNRSRALLAELYELRKSDSPPITGAETLAVVLAGTAMPRERFNEMLDALLEELPGRRVYEDKAPRLMVSSGCLEEVEHLELIENQGAAVVDDSLCFGRRYFDRLVEEGGDPLDALTDRYLNHLSCPRMADCHTQRLEYVAGSMKDYRLDGMVVEKLKFCDLWGGESFIMRREGKEKGLPVLPLERELYGGGDGQLKTRVQAFLERLGK